MQVKTNDGKGGAGMRVAVIDLGSNTVRMTVYDRTEKGYRSILSQKEVVGLIGYTRDGVLTEDGILRLTEAIRGFCETGAAVQVQRYGCFATAGLRAVCNADEVVRRIAAETGVEARVISGEEEARLDYVGVFKPAGLENGLVVDMGGGSTELIRFDGAAVPSAVSLPFGSLLLYRRFVSGILPQEKELRHIRRFVRRQLDSVAWLPGCARHACLIGGTARAVARLHRELYGREQEPLQGYSFAAGDLKDMLAHIGGNKKRAAQLLTRTTPERIHSILPGLAGLERITALARCRTVSLSLSGVREGYLHEYVGEGGGQDAGALH